jgi:hypothetical protein
MLVKKHITVGNNFYENEKKPLIITLFLYKSKLFTKK